MQTFYILACMIIGLNTVSSSSVDDSEFPNSAYLDGDENYKLYWKVNEDEKAVYFAAKVKTLGWVGFGISAGKGNMVGSDIMMGWVKDGKGYIQDRYADAKALPPLDPQQDWVLDEASEEGGYTILKFHRKINTCDEKDRKIEEGTTRVVWAYHHDDPTSPEEGFQRHSERSSRTLMLLNSRTKKPTLPDKLEYFEIRHNITIPSNGTTYMCMAYEFPQMPNKHHVVKIAPVITSANMGKVHHILVYACNSDFPRSNVSAVGSCIDANMPPAVLRCAGASVIAAWGIGGTAFYYPDHVGFPIGAGEGPQFVVMEVHYDNPKHEADKTDNSGLRFYYTNQTRQYDAGILWAGWMPYRAMVIPPQQSSWMSIGYCSGNCTRTALQNSTLRGGGINVFASFLHTHLQGQRIWTRHIRNGVELPEISRDDHYDFNYQEFLIPRKEINIKPGDDLIQMCDYQTMDKRMPVMGGLTTKQEMCMSFMLYYPKMELTKCLSANDVTRQFATAVGGIGNITWAEDQVKLYRKLLDESKTVRTNCLNNAGQRYPIYRVPKPQVTTPLKPKPDGCKPDQTSIASFNIGSVFMLMTSSVIVTVLTL